jgi:hypothetical protein
MQQEILLWTSVLLTGIGVVVLSIWLRRKRERARWRSKRPIHVRVQQDGRTAHQNTSERSAV